MISKLCTYVNVYATNNTNKSKIIKEDKIIGKIDFEIVYKIFFNFQLTNIVSSHIIKNIDEDVHQK